MSGVILAEQMTMSTEHSLPLAEMTVEKGTFESSNWSATKGITGAFDRLQLD